MKIFNCQFSIANWFAAIACLALGTSLASADTIWVSSSGANALEVGRIKVVGVEEGSKPEDRALVFQSASGQESRRPFTNITRIQLDDDPSLNAAEEAYAEGKWDVATDNYLKTLRGTTKDWLRQWAAQRLGEAAEKTGRFDAAVVAYIARAQINPADAGRKPTLPDEKSAFLPQAVKDVQAALANPKLTPPQRQALLSFQLDLHRARKDQRAAAETLEQLLKSGAADAANDPAAQAALGRLKLDVAAVALDAKQYQKAIDEIQASRAQFTDAQTQATALLLLADARYGLAQQKNDPQLWQDAGLAYMRVVAHFKDHPDRPHVATALMKTAEVHEKLNDKDAAIQLYQQVAQQFNDDPAGPRAKAQVDRLKGAGGATESKPG